MTGIESLCYIKKCTIMERYAMRIVDPLGFVCFTSHDYPVSRNMKFEHMRSKCPWRKTEFVPSKMEKVFA